MTDLEMTKLCAEAMGLKEASHYDPRTPKVHEPAILYSDRGGFEIFDPLHEDAQAMALVKKFRLTIGYFREIGWGATAELADVHFYGTDLNRAIVECVAKMQEAKCENSTS